MKGYLWSILPRKVSSLVVGIARGWDNYTNEGFNFGNNNIKCPCFFGSTKKNYVLQIYNINVYDECANNFTLAIKWINFFFISTTYRNNYLIHIIQTEFTK